MSKEPRSDNKLPEVEQELSQVATNPKQNLLILAVICIIFAYIFFNFFIKSDASKEEKQVTKLPSKVEKPAIISTDNDLLNIPNLPEIPKLEEPLPPAPPVEEINDKKAEVPNLPSAAPALPEGDNTPALAPILPSGQNMAQETDKALQRKRRSAIFLIAGTPQQKTNEELQQENDFSRRGNMNLLLGRGKMIDAVVETAINSDFGGEIRAVIQRDIYSEWGRTILIPKGSRVFGNYASGIDGAYGRIDIQWTRINLANGYIINLNGTGADALGRKGNQGRVDDKFKEKLSNAVLRSLLNIGVAKGLDTLIPPKQDSQVTANKNAEARTVQTATNNIVLDNTLSADGKRQKICNTVPGLISDKTSITYTDISNKCTALNSSTLTADGKLSDLVNTITNATNSLTQNAAADTTETQAQLASKKAYSDVSGALKEVISDQNFNKTITIEQGTAVKIYVNRDYQFPKEAIGQSRRR